MDSLARRVENLETLPLGPGAGRLGRDVTLHKKKEREEKLKKLKRHAKGEEESPQPDESGSNPPVTSKVKPKPEVKPEEISEVKPEVKPEEIPEAEGKVDEKYIVPILTE